MARPTAATITDDVRELSADDAHHLWLNVLARQGLVGGAKLTSAADVAERGLGLHAARLPSPYVTLLARLVDPMAADALFESRTRLLLTTVRCMRKTLHILPLPLAIIAHAATRHFRERDALRGAHNVGVTPTQLFALTARLVYVLAADGPLPVRQIEARLTSRRWPVLAVRAALKFAWERGELTYINRAQHWNREDRAFAATAALFPQLVQDNDETVQRAVSFRSTLTATARPLSVTWSGGPA